MHVRLRKFLGAIALILLVIFWALLGMSLAQRLPSIDGPVAVLFYVVMGFGWVLPAMPLVRWMQRSNAPSN